MASHVSGITVTNCKYGFYFYQNNGHVVVENKALENEIGFYVVRGTRNAFQENRAEHNLLAGFKLRESSFNNFKTNTAAHNKGTGFNLISNCHDNSFYLNQADLNLANGFKLHDKCSSNLLQNNKTTENNLTGFLCSHSHHNIFNFNEANHNIEHGFLLTTAHNNQFFQNYAINNKLFGFATDKNSIQNTFHQNTAEKEGEILKDTPLTFQPVTAAPPTMNEQTKSPKDNVVIPITKTSPTIIETPTTLDPTFPATLEKKEIHIEPNIHISITNTKEASKDIKYILTPETNHNNQTRPLSDANLIVNALETILKQKSLLAPQEPTLEITKNTLAGNLPSISSPETQIAAPSALKLQTEALLNEAISTPVKTTPSSCTMTNSPAAKTEGLTPLTKLAVELNTPPLKTANTTKEAVCKLGKPTDLDLSQLSPEQSIKAAQATPTETLTKTKALLKPKITSSFANTGRIDLRSTNPATAPLEKDALSKENRPKMTSVTTRDEKKPQINLKNPTATSAVHHISDLKEVTPPSNTTPEVEKAVIVPITAQKKETHPLAIKNKADLADSQITLQAAALQTKNEDQEEDYYFIISYKNSNPKLALQNETTNYNLTVIKPPRFSLKRKHNKKTTWYSALKKLNTFIEKYLLLLFYIK
jgi:hypothetical protein